MCDMRLFNECSSQHIFSRSRSRPCRRVSKSTKPATGLAFSFPLHPGATRLRPGIRPCLITPMTTEVNAATGAAAEITAPVETVSETPEVTAPEGNEQEQAKEPDANASNGDEADKALKRLQRRIDRVTATRYQEAARAEQAERRAQDLERQLRELSSGTQGEERQVNADDIDRLVSERARQIADTQAVQAKVNSIVEAGKALTPEFDALCNAIHDELPIHSGGKPTAFMEAVFDSDNPAALLVYLGNNTDVLEDLQGLSASQLGRRLDRIERDMQAKKTTPPPKPLKPVTAASGASAGKSEQTMTDAEWYSLRRGR